MSHNVPSICGCRLGRYHALSYSAALRGGFLVNNPSTQPTRPPGPHSLLSLLAQFVWLTLFLNLTLNTQNSNTQNFLALDLNSQVFCLFRRPSFVTLPASCCLCRFFMAYRILVGVLFSQLLVGILVGSFARREEDRKSVSAEVSPLSVLLPCS